MPSAVENNDDSDEFIDMQPLENDEEKVKEEKELKILTPNKLLRRLPMLLAQIKAGNNSYKLKYEIRKILYLFQQFNEVIIIMEENMIVKIPKLFVLILICQKMLMRV